MQPHRVFIVGSSLFAETMVQILRDSGTVTVIGSAPKPEAALPTFETENPDAVIVAGSPETSQSTSGLLLTTFPELPVIYADPNAEHMQVVTSKRVGTHPSDLMAALIKLPKRK
jgi:chemotaxis response regulator CheB